MNSNAKLGLLAAVCLGVIAWLLLSYAAPQRERSALRTIPYSQLLNEAQEGQIRSVVVDAEGARATYASGREVQVNPVPDPNFASELHKAGVTVSGAPTASKDSGSGALWQALMSFGPVCLLIAAMVYFMKQQASNQKNMSSFGQARSKMVKTVSRSDVLFDDVAGCDEAKDEVRELVDFLKSPGKFQKMGGRIPKGVMLSGPPGTGKTLLAQAIAGEARVPFYSVAGSDFVEMYVGVGAARVRSLFEKAKANAPCIIFIDEIDSVGRQRGAGVGGGNDEREQTLNQLLVEMDGFDKELGVIVIAATNRPDVLDNALVRPGRFDRQVHVSLPDVRGREQILNVHLRKVPSGQDVDVPLLARGTPGMSGADLANLVNEATLIAARNGDRHVQMEDFERAKDKITLGAERKSVIMPEHERRNTAFHEAGHAVIAELLDKTDPVHKVTIIPRGRALGVTLQLPEGDRYSTDKVRLENTIAVLFGGRVAEEQFMGEATTGASNDFERATALARSMVTRWGYSKTLGPMVLASNETDPHAARYVSQETLRQVDEEVRELLMAQYARTEALLEQHASKVRVMANALLEWETLDADQIQDIMAGGQPRAPKVPPDPARRAKREALDHEVGSVALATAKAAH